MTSFFDDDCVIYLTTFQCDDPTTATKRITGGNIKFKCKISGIIYGDKAILNINGIKAFNMGLTGNWIYIFKIKCYTYGYTFQPLTSIATIVPNKYTRGYAILTDYTTNTYYSISPSGQEYNITIIGTNDSIYFSGYPDIINRMEPNSSSGTMQISTANVQLSLFNYNVQYVN